MDNSWRGLRLLHHWRPCAEVRYQDHAGRMHNFYNVPVAGDLSYTFNAGYAGADHPALAIRSSNARARWWHLRAGPLDDCPPDGEPGRALDFYRTSYPTQTLGPNRVHPEPERHFPGAKVASFNDVTPKLGVAYDLLRKRTKAVKASYSRYVQQMSYGGTFGEAATPPLRTVQSVTRSWTDQDTRLHS